MAKQIGRVGFLIAAFLPQDHSVAVTSSSPTTRHDPGQVLPNLGSSCLWPKGLKSLPPEGMCRRIYGAPESVPLGSWIPGKGECDDRTLWRGLHGLLGGDCHRRGTGRRLNVVDGYRPGAGTSSTRQHRDRRRHKSTRRDHGGGGAGARAVSSAYRGGPRRPRASL